jgi:hypothetical protein
MEIPTFPTAFRARLLLKDARSLRQAAWMTRGITDPAQGIRVLIEKVRRTTKLEPTNRHHKT